MAISSLRSSALAYSPWTSTGPLDRILPNLELVADASHHERLHFPFRLARTAAQAPAAEFPEEPRWARTWVNVRAGRSGSSEAVRILDPGELVGVDSLGRGWYRVLVDGVPVGFVDRSFLAPAPPDSLPG